MSEPPNSKRQKTSLTAIDPNQLFNIALQEQCTKDDETLSTIQDTVQTTIQKVNAAIKDQINKEIHAALEDTKLVAVPIAKATKTLKEREKWKLRIPVPLDCYGSTTRHEVDRPKVGALLRSIERQLDPRITITLMEQPDRGDLYDFVLWGKSLNP